MTSHISGRTPKKRDGAVIWREKCENVVFVQSFPERRPLVTFQGSDKKFIRSIALSLR